MDAFAVIMMVMIGVFHAIEGLAALFTTEIYLVGPDMSSPSTSPHGVDPPVARDPAHRCRLGRPDGAAVGAFSRNRLGRSQHDWELLFIPYYPLWSVLIIALDFFVIWALCVYNKDAAQA